MTLKVGKTAPKRCRGIVPVVAVSSHFQDFVQRRPDPTPRSRLLSLYYDPGELISQPLDLPRLRTFRVDLALQDRSTMIVESPPSCIQTLHVFCVKQQLIFKKALASSAFMTLQTSILALRAVWRVLITIIVLR